MSHPGNWIGLTATLSAVLSPLMAGCTGDLIANLTEERSGDITVIFINDTPYRASFSFGSYEALNRDPPGPVTLQQQRLEGRTSTSPIEITCSRNTAIGTDAFIRRAIDTDAPADLEEFDADAFTTVVNFSSAPADDPAAALPTVGTAEGIEVLLGVDYACGDQLIFTFVEDEATSGVFRIEFSVLPAEEDE